MNLLSVTPIKTAKFKFVSPIDGAAVCTEKGAEMFVEILGSHAKEFQAALLEKHQRTIAICGKHNHTDEKVMSAECKKDLDESQVKFLCEITTSVLFEISGKENTSASAFYSNPDLDYWVSEVGKFAANTANFIKAQPTK